MTDKQEPLLPRVADSRAFGYWPFARHNHNVVITCVLAVLSPAADSVWQGTVLTTFLYLVYGNNSMVGFADAARGVFTLLIALPIGWAADRWSRKSRLIAIGGALAPLASGLTMYAISRVNDDSASSYTALVIALCIWGAVYTIAKGPVQAIYAGSTRAGERTGFYTLKFQLGNVAAALGRVGTIVVFASSGDRWQVANLRVLIYAGLALEGLSALAMLGFRDSALLPTEPKANTNPAERRSNASGGGPTGSPAAHPRVWMVPWILQVSSVFFGIGAGATVKYFPLFFSQDLQLSPVAVQSIFVLMPMANAAMSSLGLHMSRRIGRVQALMVLRVSSILLLAVIAVVSMHLRGSHRLAAESEWTRRLIIGVVIALYLMRSALANCTTPISTSISMDFVPGSQRARWSSLASITQACFSGSAAVGGVLADRYGYGVVFLLTSAVHVAGTLIQAALLPIVPRHE